MVDSAGMSPERAVMTGTAEAAEDAPVNVKDMTVSSMFSIDSGGHAAPYTKEGR